MQRVRMSLPFYRACGWEPVVLAVHEHWLDGDMEEDLLATVPSDVRIEKCRAIPRRWSRWLGLGTLGLRCLPFIFWRGCRLLRKEKFDLVFFSNTQFITFPLGIVWKFLFGVPYVLDFQDPWRTDYYKRPGSRRAPGGWKYQFSRFQAWALEGPSVACAAGVMSVSPKYLEDLDTRYRRFAGKPSIVLNFGASRTDLARARDLGPKVQLFRREPGLVHLVYTGASGPVTPHAVEVLFDALRSFRDLSPARAARLRLYFVGTSYAPAGLARPSVMPLAEARGVASLVEEVPHRVGFLESLRLQQEADVLMLLGSSDLAYSPSKMYVYYLTNRPILGLVFRGSVMEKLLDELSCAHMVRFSEAEDKGAAHAQLRAFFNLALDGFKPGTQPQRSEGLFNERYQAEELAHRQCAFFASVAVTPRPVR